MALLAWVITRKQVDAVQERGRDGKALPEPLIRPMAFGTLEDESGTVEVTWFPETYRACGPLIERGEPCWIQGKVAVDFGVPTLELQGDVAQAKVAIGALDKNVPIGTVIAYCGELTPNLKSLGWLPCDGKVASTHEYPDLFNILRTNYGNSDFVDSFKLPDLRGEFIRGFDDGRGADKGRILGSSQSSSTARPKTDFTGKGSVGADIGTSVSTKNGGTGAALTGIGNHGSIDSVTITINSGGDAETRPRNIALYYLIRAK